MTHKVIVSVTPEMSLITYEGPLIKYPTRTKTGLTSEVLCMCNRPAAFSLSRVIPSDTSLMCPCAFSLCYRPTLPSVAPNKLNAHKGFLSNAGLQRRHLTCNPRERSGSRAKCQVGVEVRHAHPPGRMNQEPYKRTEKSVTGLKPVL